MRAATFLLLGALLSAGCAAPLGDPPGEGAIVWPRCEDPWPCGDEWPAALRAPFDLAPPERVAIAMSDGVALDAWVHRPEVAVPVPALLWVSPYVAGCTHPLQSGSVTCAPDGSDLAALDAYVGSLGERLPEFPTAGFALIVVSVRGTGHSGGCFDMGGAREQEDMAALIDWAAKAPWSNGRVGAYGLSYMGMTALEGAASAHPALKAIVAGGVVTDVYQVPYTTQGATASTVLAAAGLWSGMAALVSAPLVGDPAELPNFAGSAASRACPSQAEHQRALSPIGSQADRDPAYFEPRRILDRLPEARAAVLIIEGHLDPALPRQDDIMWDRIGAPKRMVVGQWGHTFPRDEMLADHPGGTDHLSLAIPWLDFWLKGLGEVPPGIGEVASQRSDGAWHAFDAWPPSTDVHLAAAHLTAAGFADAPDEAPRMFLAMPHSTPPLCERAGDAIVTATGPLEKPLVLAGNPFAYIVLESDAPAGVVHLYLLDVEGEGCNATATRISEAAADLRFHAGGYAARPFPVATPTPVRFDLWGADHIVPEGHRLMLVATGPSDSFGTPPARVSFHPGSHLVVPVLEGALPGGPLLEDYPPRPFSGQP